MLCLKLASHEGIIPFSARQVPDDAPCVPRHVMAETTSSTSSSTAIAITRVVDVVRVCRGQQLVEAHFLALAELIERHVRVLLLPAADHIRAVCVADVLRPRHQWKDAVAERQRAHEVVPTRGRIVLPIRS